MNCGFFHLSIAISFWLNELAKNPYIRSDPSFLAFVTKDDFRFANEPELNSLSMHNTEVKVNMIWNSNE